MALTDKDILITPNIGSANEPKIEFKGASASVGPSTITATIYPTNNGTLSFDGTAGQLFSITNNLTSGSIFSVNDVSGIPSIDVDANGTINFGSYGGNIGVGVTNPTQKLHVQGNVRITGAVYDNNNLPGTSGQVLKSTGAGVTWVSGSGSGIDADNLDGYTWATAGKNIRGDDIYADNWFRNYNSGEGLFNEATAMHWYSDANWRFRLYSTSTASSILFTTNGDTARGYVYADTASSIGFLNAAGEWGLRYLSSNGNSPNLYFREEANEDWTGNPGNDEGKIEYHSNRFYIASGSNSAEIARFRQSGNDRVVIQNDGNILINGNTVWYAGNVTGVVAVANGGSGATTRISASNSIANFGNLQSHTTFTDANAVQQWGGTFIQGASNCPNFNGNQQHYNMMWSLGSEYDWGSNQVYAMQMCIARNVSTPYIGIRYKEGGNNTANWGSWQKIAAGTADIAGTLDGGSAFIGPSHDISFTTGNWTGEKAGKIQFHSNNLYLQFTTELIGRNASGTNVFTLNSSGNATFTGNVSGATGTFGGNLTVSTGNANGGGIILADDGDIVDLNDGYCAMRFSNGVRIHSGNRTGSAVITLGSNGTVSASTFIGNLTGNVTGNVTGSAGSVAFSNVTSKPTTLSGYDITDAQSIPIVQTVTLSGQIQVTFSGMPTSVRNIRLIFHKVKKSGTIIPLVNLGSPDGTFPIVTYTSTSTRQATSNSTGGGNSTAGFLINIINTTMEFSGHMDITRLGTATSGPIWTSSHFGKVTTANTIVGGGDFTGGAAVTIDRVKVHTNSTDAWTGGTITCIYWI